MYMNKDNAVKLLNNLKGLRKGLYKIHPNKTVDKLIGLFKSEKWEDIVDDHIEDGNLIDSEQYCDECNDDADDDVEDHDPEGVQQQMNLMDAIGNSGCDYVSNEDPDPDGNGASSSIAQGFRDSLDFVLKGLENEAQKVIDGKITEFE